MLIFVFEKSDIRTITKLLYSSWYSYFLFTSDNIIIFVISSTIYLMKLIQKPEWIAYSSQDVLHMDNVYKIWFFHFDCMKRPPFLWV